MGYITTTKDYWIAPNAVYITLNALGQANRVQGSVASGTVISCYIESITPGGDNGDGLLLDNGRNPKRWPLSLSPTYFNNDEPKYVYAAIPRKATISSQAVIVFPSEQLDIYGKNSTGEQIGSVDYFYVYLQGIISAPSGTPLQRSWTKAIGPAEWGSLGTYADIVDMTTSSEWYNYDKTTGIVTFLKNIIMKAGSSFHNLFLAGKELTSVADETTPVDSDTAVATPDYVSKHFLSKLSADTAAGRITFEDGLTALGVSSFQDFVEMLGQVIFGGAIQSRNFVSSFNGWAIDILGNAEFESVKVRSALEVLELLINRMQAQEGDTLFTDNDQIEAVEKRTDPTDGSVSYILTLKEKWEGYITPQQYGNILKGIINTLAAKEAGVSDYEGQTVETDGSNSYYTSWMRVIATHNTDANLGVNQIRVVLYGDTDEQGKPIVPAGKNYEPCQLMTVGRWGCVDYSSEYEGTAEYEAVKRSIEKRQRLFLISTSDGRMMKLTGVDAPILKNGNYGFSLGELPEFVAAYPTVQKRMIPGLDYLYAQGIVVQDYIKIDKEGLPEVTRIDCGEWVDGADLISKGETPRPRYGIYLVGELNEDSGWNESHDVWHEGHKWRCLQHQPVVSGGVQTYYEPKWNSPYWLMIEGNDNLTIEFVSSKGYSFRRGAVDTVITPHLFYGNVDITADVAAEYWNWTRESESGKTVQDETWDAQHQQQKTLNLTNTDMPSTWSTRDKAIFTCTVTLNDGKTTRIVQNQIIS